MRHSATTWNFLSCDFCVFFCPFLSIDADKSQYDRYKTVLPNDMYLKNNVTNIVANIAVSCSKNPSPHFWQKI